VVEFRVLGPLVAVVDGVPVPLGPPQQRALLALLALHAGEVVSRDRIVDELWGERPPATSAKLVQGYVSGLRKLVGADVLVTRAPGYLLAVEAGALDLAQFERLVGEGRAALGEGDPGRAAVRLREALALWRGPALANLVSAPFVPGEASRLEELRLSAVCDRIEADLALGQDDVVPELEALGGRAPDARALAAAAHARALSRGAAGRSACRLPGRPPCAGGRAGHRAAPRGASARAGDPARRWRTWRSCPRRVALGEERGAARLYGLLLPFFFTDAVTVAGTVV